MKRILFVAATATLLAAGCQKTEIINHVGGDVMTFSTYMSKLTKASDADSSGTHNLQNQNFKVWAYCAYEDAINDVSKGDVYDEMSALDVEYKNGNWTTDLDYYWPGTAKKLDFFAVSTGATWKEGEVSGIEWNITNGGQTLGQRSMTLNGYTVNNSKPDDDLMVAEFVRQDQSMNSKNVKLHFKHALSKVQFKFYTNASANDTVKVNSLVVDSLKTTGKLTVTEAHSTYIDGTGRVMVDLAWDPADTVMAQFVDDYADSLTLDSTPNEFATWLVLPQDITDKTVKINYTINSRTFDQIFALTREAVAEVKDTTGNVTTQAKDAFKNWGINQVIVYTINLSPNKITFTPSVEDWAAETPQTDVN